MQRFGIEKKVKRLHSYFASSDIIQIFGLICDSASNNDTMVGDLQFEDCPMGPES
jgi:hypothetical protein